jgi:thiopeptide-type bacteriocin biosynthesis protein
LRDEIAPLVRALRDSNALEGWFFLRLADPQPHLRVRLQGEPSLVLNPVIELAQRAITAGTARDASIATYEREVERYGGPEGVELAERIFAADSDAALGLVANSGDIPDGVTQRWRIAVLGAELLLRDLALSLPERVELVRRRQARLETVLRFDADQKRELSLRLRKYRAELESLVALAPEEVVPPSVARLFRQRTQKLVPLARELDRLAVLGVLGRPRLELAASYLHMFHTRLHAKDTLGHELFTVAALHRTLTAVLRPGASERV